MHVVLVEPQIPPNTGNIARLCAATRTTLHLVGPLGFRITDRHLRRAGLDYWEHVDIQHHASLQEFLGELAIDKLYFFSKKAQRSYLEASFRSGDYLVFGSETGGLPEWLLEAHPQRFFRIPISHPQVRSLNLSTSVAVALYEALRQAGQLREDGG